MALLAILIDGYSRIAGSVFGNFVLVVVGLVVVLPCSVAVLRLLFSVIALCFGLMWCGWTSADGSWVGRLSSVVFGRRSVVVLEINCICPLLVLEPHTNLALLIHTSADNFWARHLAAEQ